MWAEPQPVGHWRRNNACFRPFQPNQHPMRGSTAWQQQQHGVPKLQRSPKGTSASLEDSEVDTEAALER